MDKCPKCGADAYGFIEASGAGIYKCGSTDQGFDPEHPAPFVSVDCLSRQLAAANERVERMEKALRDAIEHVAGSRIGHYGDHTAYCDITVRPERLTAWVKALEVPDAL